MSRNYYVILGIPVDSTQPDIKSAYRRLAKEFHPDYYGQNHEPFQVLQEAYSVLSDPERRRVYDESLQDTLQDTLQDSIHDTVQNTAPKYPAQNVQPVYRSYREIVEPLASGPDTHFSNRHRRFPKRSFSHPNTPLNSIFDEVFGRSRGSEQPEPGRYEDVTVEVSLTPGQARSGGRLRLQVPIRRPCHSCHGQGYFRYAPCYRCHGAGVLSGEEIVVLRFPAGIRNKQSLRFVLRPSSAAEISLTVIFRTQ
jgi:DnaJ-class molecular chaperone